jgi:integrase
MQDDDSREPAARRFPSGIEVHHQAGCPRRGERITKCDRCKLSFRGKVYDRRAHRHVRQPWQSGRGGLAQAKSWLVDARHKVAAGTLRTPNRMTVRDAWGEWHAGALAGTIRNRGELVYKPSTIRSYAIAYRRQIDERIGALRLTNVRRRDLQSIVDQMLADGYSASAAGNTINAMRVVIKKAIEDEVLTTNPAAGLRIPPADGERNRVADVGQATRLIEALPNVLDRALFAAAVFSGLRRGELRGLLWDDVDLANGRINVSRSWDDYQGEITPKSKKGTRSVPLAGRLRDLLDELKIATGRKGADLVFGREARLPFIPSVVQDRADRAWQRARESKAAELALADGLVFDELEEREREGYLERAGFERVTLHDLRHSYVSLMHAAGLSLEEIGDYVGHSSAYMTEQYRHLLEGHEDATREKFDAYLDLADTEARMRQIAGGS